MYTSLFFSPYLQTNAHEIRLVHSVVYHKIFTETHEYRVNSRLERYEDIYSLHPLIIILLIYTQSRTNEDSRQEEEYNSEEEIRCVFDDFC